MLNYLTRLAVRFRGRARASVPGALDGVRVCGCVVWERGVRAQASVYTLVVLSVSAGFQIQLFQGVGSDGDGDGGGFTGDATWSRTRFHFARLVW
jgi:hypothetical protein